MASTLTSRSHLREPDLIPGGQVQGKGKAGEKNGTHWREGQKPNFSKTQIQEGLVLFVKLWMSDVSAFQIEKDRERYTKSDYMWMCEKRNLKGRGI